MRMPRIAALFCVLTASAAALQAGEKIFPPTEERATTSARIRGLVRLAIDRFMDSKAFPDTEKGNRSLIKARDLLNQALALDPSDRDAKEILDEVGDHIVHQMNASGKLGRAPSILMALRKKYLVKMMYNQEAVRKSISDYVEQAVNPLQTNWLE